MGQRGTPDYGQYAPATTIARLADLGELAVRLGSIVSFDRRGEVVWMDDFEDGIIKWKTSAAGAGAAVTSDTVKSRNGAKSAKLVAGSDGGKQATLYHYQPFPVSSRYGVEFSFAFETSPKHIGLRLDLYDGANHYFGDIVYRPPLTRLDYEDSNADYQALTTTLDLLSDSIMFHTLKLVADWSTKKYVRLLLDNNSYDLSGIDLYSAADAVTLPQVRVRVLLAGTSGNPVLYVDDVIITQNEP
ncbi:hypothetical protein LCGC14_1290060 [marine sediment metagenome]|uniref:Malectin domain-containing protein n=1 Tax=marine sediment metagenome TaxID=412755 RepID=A0A0F9KSU2_9ZZZZ